MNNIIKLITVILLFLSVSVSVSKAASLTEYRIYLDHENRIKKYVLGNSTQHTEQCEIEFTNMRFDENGELNPLITEAVLESHTNDVLSRIKFSPKKVTLDPLTRQTVNFVLKRTPNKEEAKEYRAYVDIRCKKVDDNTDLSTRPQISITPTIVQRVPIIIRTGELDASLTFAKIENHNNVKLDVILGFTGSRSIYGDMKIYFEDKAITQKKGIAIYPETSQKKLKIGIPLKYRDEKLTLRFEERTIFGGDIKLTSNLSER